MLILTRRIGEVLKIGDDISVTVLDVKGNQVRIGITAPGDVPVHREEIWLRIQNGEPDSKEPNAGERAAREEASAPAADRPIPVTTRRKRSLV